MSVVIYYIRKVDFDSPLKEVESAWLDECEYYPIPLQPSYSHTAPIRSLKKKGRFPHCTVRLAYKNGDTLGVVVDEKAVMKKVQKGMENDELVVIEKGLNVGDTVIKDPQQKGLKQGKRVE